MRLSGKTMRIARTLDLYEIIDFSELKQMAGDSRSIAYSDGNGGWVVMHGSSLSSLALAADKGLAFRICGECVEPLNDFMSAVESGEEPLDYDPQQNPEHVLDLVKDYFDGTPFLNGVSVRDCTFVPDWSGFLFYLRLGGVKFLLTTIPYVYKESDVE